MALSLNRSVFAWALLVAVGCGEPSEGSDADTQSTQADTTQGTDADIAQATDADMTQGTDADVAPRKPCLLSNGSPDPACCVVDEVYWEPGEVLPGYTCEICGEKADGIHYPSAPDGTLCGPETDEDAREHQHCIYGSCCTPNARTYWDQSCGCGWFGGDYSNCADENGAAAREQDFSCAEQCGGYCCEEDWDCPEERPYCAGFVDSPEGMAGWCVAQVELPSCWVDAQCPALQKCRGGSAEDTPLPGCTDGGPSITPGTCGE